MTGLRLHLLMFIAALGLALPARAAEGRAGRPNIIIILTDDMGWSDIGCFGGEIDTPNLDRLAANGLRFTQFYNTGRCCPTRASLLTGLYAHQAGVGHMVDDRGLPGYRGELNDRCATIPEVLRGVGYGTFMAGKWHVTRNQAPDGPRHAWPLQRGFDRFYGTLAGSGNYFSPKALQRDNAVLTATEDVDYKPDQYYYTDAITDHAVRFIGDHTSRHGDRPFFLYVAYTAAHWPLHAKPADIAKYKGRYDAGYEAIRQARLDKQRRLGLLNPKWTPGPLVGSWDKVADKAYEIRCMEVYAAQVDCMDQGVGRIVAALEKAGQLNNTLLMYLQDNGACAEPLQRVADQKAGKLPGPADTQGAYGRDWANVSNTPLRYYKSWVHEGGISTPLIVHWPVAIARTRNGSVVSDLGHVIDLMATCVDVSGAAYPKELNGKPIQPMEGVSLRPAIEGNPLVRTAPIMFEHQGNKAIRETKWKLVLAHGPKASWELYDIENDRAEMNDLAEKEPDRATRMADQWNAWAKRVGVEKWPVKAAARGTAAP